MSGPPDGNTDVKVGEQSAVAGLLEREREVAQLDELVSGVAGHGARMALIEGAAGIGKTTLLNETRRLAASDGIAVLAARGSELEREFPFGVVRQLFEPVLVDPKARKDAFAGAAAAAAPIFETPGEGAAAGVEDTGFATLHGLYWVTLNLAGERPLLLSIDDLQWVDRPSFRFLAYLVRRLEDVPVLVGATLRSHEPGSDTALIAEVANDPLTALISPGPLSAEAVTELIAARLERPADADFAHACHLSTGGNPLLLHELLRALRAERVEPIAANAGVVRDLGPRAASRAVLLRLARLPAEAAKVARAVAVLGDGAELWAVADLAGLDERAVAEGTGALARSEILRHEPPLGFVHPLVRDAVYLELPPGERELEHQRAAQLLHEAGAKPEQIAAHLLNTPRSSEPWVADVLEQAGRTGARTGAAESAAAYLRRALDEPLEPPRRARILSELGHAEMHSRGKDAAVHLGEAYEMLEDPIQRAEVGFALARTLNFTRAPEEANAVARRALEELPDGHDDMRHALEAIELMTVIFGAAPREQLTRLEAYRSDLVGEGPGARMLASISAFHWSNAGGTARECVELARAALADDVLVKQDNGLYWVTANVVLVYADDPRAVEVWEAARREAHRNGSLFAILSVNLWRGWNLLRWGDLPEAEESLLAAAEEMSLWGSEQGTVNEYPAAFLAETRIERGDLGGAREALEASGKFDAKGDGANFWRGSRAELLFNEGRLDEALEACDEYRSRLMQHMNPTPHPWRSLRAVICDRLGRTEEGIELAAQEVELARRWGAPGALGRALRTQGTLMREDGLDLLREAVEVLDGSPSRLQLAKALCALGTAERLARRQKEAREPLRRALELADVCGAEPLAERARTELQATGARPRTSALTGIESLTPSERRVADLAAEGMSNREIAQELYVTPKTVEVHLSNSYRKLEIAGRRELPRALAAA
jgi:DNA-binding CsgD family transcriptional regulator